MSIDQGRHQDQARSTSNSLVRRLQQLGLLGFLFFLIKGLAWVALGVWLAWEIN